MNKKSTTFKVLMLSGFLAFSTLSAQNYEMIISDYLNSNSSSLKKSPIANREFIISNIDHSESMKADVLQVQQTFNSIPVYHGLSTFMIRNNQVDYAKENFVSNFDISKTKIFSKTSIKEEQLAKTLFSSVLTNVDSQDMSKYIFDEDNTLEKGEKVLTKLVYFPKNNQLNLAMEFNFNEVGSPNYWHILVDVDTKEILLKENLTVSCQFEHGTFGHDDHSEHNHNIPSSSNTNVNTNKSSVEESASNASYNVFPLPVEAPTFGARQLISNPWDLSASPEGWHDDGKNSYTITRGNNVFAYEDINSTDSPSYVTDAGSSRIFDYPLDINSNLESYTDAAITNLFYVNNKVHDVFYKLGFTESARNFQENNFDKGGVGNDAVFAESRDGYGEKSYDYLNNANFYPAMEGSRPRMQMYVFDPNPATIPQRLKFNSPAEMTGLDFKLGTALTFGPYTTEDPIIGDLTKTSPANGCTAITNNLSGKIAFIERGSCDFVLKTKNAQNAGASAVVVYNITSDQTIGGMSGTDSSVTIPAALISYEDGQQVLSKLNSNIAVNATYQDAKSKYIWLDASLDNGIIIHEYGHGISNRLTSMGYGCLSTSFSNEQMGEGWSDFFALMLTNRPGDTADTPRGMGTFVNAESISGNGIRPARYSPDFKINNYTYGKTNGMTYVNKYNLTAINVHSIGFVWATMLWDLHWKFVEKYGYSSNVLENPNSGSAKVLQLVVDGLKLQSCNPTFIDGRDAILAADKAKGGEDRCMIWGAFAKRGLGEKASAGTKTGVTTGINDQVEDFTVPEDCKLSTNEIAKNTKINIYPNPAKNEVTVFASDIKGKVNIQLFDISGRNVLEVSENISSGAKIDVSRLTDGVYIIKGKGLDADFSQKIIIKK